MGVNDRVRDAKDKSRRAAEEKRKLRSSAGSNGQIADWTGVNGELLCKFIAAVSRDGGAARLGYTRDGGAYAIGIYGDGTPYTVYVSPKEDLDEWLRAAAEDFNA